MLEVELVSLCLDMQGESARERERERSKMCDFPDFRTRETCEENCDPKHHITDESRNKRISRSSHPANLSQPYHPRVFSRGESNASTPVGIQPIRVQYIPKELTNQPCAN